MNLWGSKKDNKKVMTMYFVYRMFYIKPACHCFGRIRKFLILNYFFTSYHLVFWQMDEGNFIAYLKVASFQKWRRNLINQCRYHILKHYSFSSYMYKKILTIYFDREIKMFCSKMAPADAFSKKYDWWIKYAFYCLLKCTIPMLVKIWKHYVIKWSISSHIFLLSRIMI